MIRTTLAAAALTALTAPAFAEVYTPNIYAYPTHENFCPAGLQPVTINGTICCGTPNQHITYQQAMSHPVVRRHAPKRVVRHAPRRAAIPLKGNDSYVPMGKGLDN